MQNKLSIKSAFAAVLCVSLAVFLADKSLYSDTMSPSIWNIPFGKPSSIWTALSYNYQIEPANVAQSSVSSEIQWFQKHQDYITELTHNAQPYIFYIYQQLRQRHMPAELALLPMVESSYKATVSSNVGATGLWQMMPDTASGLGLKGSGADGRRNVIASTNAALNYLAYLHRVFGSWSLALAAYNAGEGTVEKAIKENIKKHLPTNFWSLHLPKETEEYVPKLLALAAIVENPQHYNVHLEPVANQAYFGAVKVNQKMNLLGVAKLANSDTSTLQKLNPGVKSASTTITPKAAKYLLVPIDKMPVLQAKLQVAPKAPVVANAPATVKTSPAVHTSAKASHAAVAKHSATAKAATAHKAAAHAHKTASTAKAAHHTAAKKEVTKHHSVAHSQHSAKKHSPAKTTKHHSAKPHATKKHKAHSAAHKHS